MRRIMDDERCDEEGGSRPIGSVFDECSRELGKREFERQRTIMAGALVAFNKWQISDRHLYVRFRTERLSASDSVYVRVA